MKRTSQIFTRLSMAGLLFLTGFMTIVGFFLSVASLLINAATYDSRIAGYLLPQYPRYQQAHEGLRVLEDRKDAVLGDGALPIQVGVLNIDHPSWPVILDFIKSETAIRKSERNEPGSVVFVPHGHASDVKDCLPAHAGDAGCARTGS